MTIEFRIAAPWRHHLSTALLAATLIAAPAAFAQSTGAQSTGAQSGGKPSAGHEYKVVLRNMDFGAVPSNLKVGDTIVWVNQDTVIHSATARDHSFDLRLNPGQSAKMPLAKAGKIPFYCLFHPNMRGTLAVAAK